MQKDFVRASEISEFCFCKRGWWLRFHKALPTTQEMIKGTAQHELIVKRTQQFHRIQPIPYILIASGIVVILVSFLLFFFHIL